MFGFEYPNHPHTRRHGPEGYKDHESYRDWLRDEFLFRCVYCLHREKWYGRPTTFHIDHLRPVVAYPQGKLEYVNMVYACSTCNNAKLDILGVPDPCVHAFGESLKINDDGFIEAINGTGESLIKKLKLNNPSNLKYRFRWIRVLKALIEQDPNLFRETMAFPDELPDLRNKSAPKNCKPDGIERCWFALRERGELPETY